jgi:hypothetical protein
MKYIMLGYFPYGNVLNKNMRYFVLIILSFLVCSLLSAQKLFIGVKSVLPVNSAIETPSHFNYYFADDINSSYYVAPENSISAMTLITLRPYIHYMFNDNLFMNYELSVISYLKTVRIRYNNTYVHDIGLDTRFNYTFFTNSVVAGYKFLRGKEIRPRVYFGASTYSLLAFNEVTQRAEKYKLINQYPYGQIIHQNFTPIRNNFYTYTLGVGFDYYVLNIDFCYDFTPKTVGSNKTSIYKNYNSSFITIGVNLWSFLIRSKKIIRFKDTEGNE